MSPILLLFVFVSMSTWAKLPNVFAGQDQYLVGNLEFSQGKIIGVTNITLITDVHGIISRLPSYSIEFDTPKSSATSPTSAPPIARPVTAS